MTPSLSQSGYGHSAHANAVDPNNSDVTGAIRKSQIPVNEPELFLSLNSNSARTDSSLRDQRGRSAGSEMPAVEMPLVNWFMEGIPEIYIGES
jgi:hypothetical protein